MSRQNSGDLLEKAALGAEPGVGEDGVEPAEGLDRRGGERLVVGPLGDVAAHGDRLVGAAELVGELCSSSSRRAASTSR